MNISLAKNDTATGGVITIEIVPADYAETVKKNLRDYCQKVKMPGFRSGVVPKPLLQKHNLQLIQEEVQKLLQESFAQCTEAAKPEEMAEIIPHASNPKDIDPAQDLKFKYDVFFKFDIPTLTLDKSATFPFYIGLVDDAALNQQIEQICREGGRMVALGADQKVEETDLFKGKLTQLENGQPKEGGIVTENAIAMPRYIRNADVKAQFMDATPTASFVFDPFIAYEGAETEIAYFLRIGKDKLEEAKGEYRFEVQEIQRHTPCEVNQELFDRYLGKGVATNEETFRTKLKEWMEAALLRKSDEMLLMDVMCKAMQKAGDVPLAEDIIKERWMRQDAPQDGKEAPKKKEPTPEEFALIFQKKRYSVVLNNLARTYNIQVTEDEFAHHAWVYTRQLLQSLGMKHQLPNKELAVYVNHFMQDDDARSYVEDTALSNNLFFWFKENITLDTQELSIEAFEKKYQEIDEEFRKISGGEATGN